MDQAEKGSAKGNGLMKGLSRLYLFNSPQEHHPKTQVSISDNKRSWITFEYGVYRHRLC